MIKFLKLSRIDKIPLLEIPVNEEKKFTQFIYPIFFERITPLIDHELIITNPKKSEQLRKELAAYSSYYCILKIWASEFEVENLIKDYLIKNRKQKLIKLNERQN